MISPSLKSVNCGNTLRANDATMWLATANMTALKNSLDWATAQPRGRESGSRLNDQGKYPFWRTPHERGPFCFMPEFGDFRMRAFVHHLQVFRTVIRRNPINMMDNLIRREISTELRFHNQAVSPFLCQAKRRYGLNCVERHRRQDKEPVDNSKSLEIKGMGSQVQIRTEGI